MKKVTPLQVERLYQFTAQHYVEYYDVQTELVDHLANAIEEQWQENPDKDFEKALYEEFKKFGIFGFMNVVEAREKAMTKKYLKLIFKELLSFLFLPKMIMTFLLITVVCTVFMQVPYGGYVVTGAVFLILVWQAYLAFKNRKARKQAIRANQRKPYLLEHLLETCGASLGLLHFLFQIIIHLPGDFQNFTFWSVVGFSVFMSFVIIIGYVMLFEIPRKQNEILQQVYPDYHLAM
ncbi:hypothetical protein [Mesonia sp. K7]|uniref:hypothetical protein n=1 Tax=Mesonia sp. K7 TaxID=2218606 RepID=UPI000DA82EA1|nr:hypothetical protein [Mesonia sp. K7]PZD79090.1 hypothetical protein DNG35_03535 [Mesonia sp. K7]